MARYYNDGASDEKPVTHQRKIWGTEPINLSSDKPSKRLGCYQKTSISGNCKSGHHSTCFNLSCPCGCHPKVK